MFTVDETVFIDHPIAGVFDFVADARNRPQWDTTVVSERFTSPPPLGVDSTIESRLRALGREVDFAWRVTEFDPPRRMSITSTSGPLPTTLTFDLAAFDAATTLTASIQGDPSGLMRLAEPLIADAVRANLSAGLARVEALLNARDAG